MRKCIRIAIGLLMLTALSNASMAQKPENSRPRLIVKVTGGRGFYRMDELNDAYLATRRQWPSLDTGNEILGINESLSEGPGKGFDFGFSATVPINDGLAVGIQMDKVSDGFEISVDETRYSNLFGSFTASFLEGNIDADALAIEAIAVFFPKKMMSSANAFLQVGIGFGRLGLKSSFPTTLKASDICLAASANIGIESGLIWGIFRLEATGGVRWLRFKGFDVSNRGQIPTQDLNAFEIEMLDIYDNGTVDFSGAFLRAGLAIQLF